MQSSMASLIRQLIDLAIRLRRPTWLRGRDGPLTKNPLKSFSTYYVKTV